MQQKFFSEKALSSGPSERRGGMADGSGHTVVRRQRVLLGGFGIALAISMVEIAVEINDRNGMVWCMVFGAFFGAAGVGILIRRFVTKTIFDNNGITVKSHLRLGDFTLIDNVRSMPWNAVNKVTYDCGSKHRTAGFGVYYTTPDGKTQRMVINNMETNYKKAAIYAARKIPKDRFDKSATNKLGRMGVRFWLSREYGDVV